MVRAFIAVVVLAGCGAPAPLFCIDDSVCGGGSCIDQFCADSDLTCSSGYRYHESAGERAGECTGEAGGSGDGSDAGGESFTDPVVTLTEGDAGATANASSAQDDIQPPCATNPTGRDVMFEITVPAQLPRLYIDTFGTAFDVVLAVYEGSCDSISSATTPLGCVTSGCDGHTMQWSENVRAGVHCVVVDQATTAAASAVHVRGFYGPPATDATAGVNTSSTCGQNLFAPTGLCGVSDGVDHAWLFMECAGTTWTASTPSSWPGDVEARTRTEQYDCEPGYVGADFTLATPGPVWIVAHQGSGACGTVSLTVETY